MSRDDADVTIEHRDDERTCVAELEIAAPPAEVWRAITEGDRIANWFAFQAESQPGPDGHIWMSWDGHFDNRLAIRGWEENRRLVTTWPVPAPHGELVELAVEYRLEAKGASTLLRLVHSGFGAGDDWDDIVDEHRRGWAAELRCLRHYLEHHRDRRRGIVKVEVPVSPDSKAAWDRLWSRDGWLAEGALPESAGDEDYAVTLRNGEQLEGKILFLEAPTDLLMTVDNLARALLRIHISRWSEGEPNKLRLWLLSWRMSDRDRDQRQSSWQSELARIFATAAV